MIRAIFVQLGNPAPLHLIANIDRHIRLFPNIPVTVISDNQNNFIGLNFNQIQFHHYSPNLEFNLAFADTNHNLQFRNGFWRHTIERLIALADYHSTCPNDAILHIESDVILLPQFPWEKLLEVKTLLWGRYNQIRDVAALLYSPNLDSSLWLQNQIILRTQFNNEITDMTVLSEISHTHKKHIGLFPSIDPNQTSLWNLNSQPNSDEIEHECTSFEKFQGIFDAQSIGMWFAGIDPKNFFGISIIHDDSILKSGESFIDPSKVIYNYSDHSGLTIISDNKETRLWSLHVHSKNLRLFGENWETELVHHINLSRSIKKYYKFNFFILFQLLATNKKQNTLFAYLLHIPLAAKLKILLRSIFK